MQPKWGCSKITLGYFYIEMLNSDEHLKAKLDLLEATFMQITYYPQG